MLQRRVNMRLYHKRILLTTNSYTVRIYMFFQCHILPSEFFVIVININLSKKKYFCNLFLDYSVIIIGAIFIVINSWNNSLQAYGITTLLKLYHTEDRRPLKYIFLCLTKLIK